MLNLRFLFSKHIRLLSKSNNWDTRTNTLYVIKADRRWKHLREVHSDPVTYLLCTNSVTPRWGHLAFILSCHLVLSFPVLFWRINSPLVSARLLFLMCRQSDCLPWFPIVSTCSHFPPCVLIVCVSLCPVPVCSLPALCSCVHPCLSIVKPSHCILLLLPPTEWFWFVSFAS